jgi:deazaflavin-dependent oxidoreductase (nitroreductase family)
MSRREAMCEPLELARTESTRDALPTRGRERLDLRCGVRVEAFCYLTTTGRQSGRPHRIEIWFATEDERTLLLMSGGRESADWVRNIAANPAVEVEVAGVTHQARARILTSDDDEDALARRLLLEKYCDGQDLDSWGRSALAVAIDLDPVGA